MKKHISLLLVLAMLICVLAGCGSGTAPAETTAAATQAAAATAAAEATDSEGWPAIGTPDAPVTVKVVCKDVFPDEEDVVSLVAAINEKMAAHGQYVNVEFVDPPSSSYKTAMPLAVMNGEVDADLIYFQGGDEAVSAQGLLDPDFLTNTWDVMEQRWYDGDAAIVAGTAGGTVQVYDTKMRAVHGEDAALTILPPAKGVSQAYTSIDVTKESRGYGINADSQNKDAAWAVMEFMASPEGRILDKVGIEGKQYNIEDGKIVFTDKFSGWWARFWDTTDKLDPETPLAEPVLTPAASESLEMVGKFSAMDHSLLIPEELAPQWDAMTNLYNEYAADIIRGVKSIDSFDAFVEEWNNAGGNDFDALLQTTFQ